MIVTVRQAIEPSIAIKWLVLSNVQHGWPHSTNIRRESAEEGMLWAIGNGLITEGKITAAGDVWLMSN